MNPLTMALRFWSSLVVASILLSPVGSVTTQTATPAAVQLTQTAIAGRTATRAAQRTGTAEARLTLIAGTQTAAVTQPPATLPPSATPTDWATRTAVAQATQTAGGDATGTATNQPTATPAAGSLSLRVFNASPAEDEESHVVVYSCPDQVTGITCGQEWARNPAIRLREGFWVNNVTWGDGSWGGFALLAKDELCGSDLPAPCTKNWSTPLPGGDLLGVAPAILAVGGSLPGVVPVDLWRCLGALADCSVQPTLEDADWDYTGTFKPTGPNWSRVESWLGESGAYGLVVPSPGGPVSSTQTISSTNLMVWTRHQGGHARVASCAPTCGQGTPYREREWLQNISWPAGRSQFQVTILDVPCPYDCPDWWQEIPDGPDSGTQTVVARVQSGLGRAEPSSKIDLWECVGGLAACTYLPVEDANWDFVDTYLPGEAIPELLTPGSWVLVYPEFLSPPGNKCCLTGVYIDRDGTVREGQWTVYRCAPEAGACPDSSGEGVIWEKVSSYATGRRISDVTWPTAGAGTAGNTYKIVFGIGRGTTTWVAPSLTGVTENREPNVLVECGIELYRCLDQTAACEGNLPPGDMWAKVGDYPPGSDLLEGLTQNGGYAMVYTEGRYCVSGDMAIAPPPRPTPLAGIGPTGPLTGTTGLRTVVFQDIAPLRIMGHCSVPRGNLGVRTLFEVEGRLDSRVMSFNAIPWSGWGMPAGCGMNRFVIQPGIWLPDRPGPTWPYLGESSWAPEPEIEVDMRSSRFPVVRLYRCIGVNCDFGAFALPPSPHFELIAEYHEGQLYENEAANWLTEQTLVITTRDP